MVLASESTVRQRVRSSATVDETEGLTVLSFHALGTVCRVSLVEPSRWAANAYLDALLNWVADFEAKYSRFLETSLICRINAGAGRDWVAVDEETDLLLELCHQMHFLTSGAFDATSLPLLRLWNWKARPSALPMADQVQAALRLVGWKKVQRRPGAIFLPEAGMGLDLGGIGKEYAVDRVVEMAKEYGVAKLMVDFGQDIRVIGTPLNRPAWHIGMEHPMQLGSCWGSVALQDGAVACSGDYRRHFEHEGRKYGHIIDPRNGWPVNSGCRVVTAIAPSCTMAGILTTTAFILGPQEGARFIESQVGASGAILTDQHRYLTRRFHEHLVQQT
jgi:thiamine biosynthesis lipoprotein